MNRPETATLVASDADEIGRFWFVVYDGGGSDLAECALVAEERSPGLYDGFWTYDSGLVDGLAAYLTDRYPQG
ncbi:MAG: hypothetical protein ABEJ28_00480 [Salinigranum sp.]